MFFLIVKCQYFIDKTHPGYPALHLQCSKNKRGYPFETAPFHNLFRLYYKEIAPTAVVCPAVTTTFVLITGSRGKAGVMVSV